MLLETTSIVNVAKCDFCTKDAVGYTNYQICLYCANHQQMAEERTREILDSMERDRRHMAEILDRTVRLCDTLRKIKGIKEDINNG